MRLALLSVICSFGTCMFSQPETHKVSMDVKTEKEIGTGASQFNKYFSALQNKRVAFVGNHTSIVNRRHLLDSLLSLKVNVIKVFFPEHGFRGDEDAGATVKNYKDKKTGLPCISLYGKENKKPRKEDLTGIDVVLFDIQDVGARFYTYISTLHYVMEACAEQKIKLIVLDRPNPNGYYVDGPVLEESCKSFVGMHPVPIVHGMTIGEYARMINGEGWLSDKIQCELEVIPVSGYEHSDYFELNVKPSPNLPNAASVYLYPSLCLFEGTIVSVGRGTDLPFQQFGYPGMTSNGYSFKPEPKPGASKDPVYNGKKCDGFNVSFYGEMFMKHYKQLYLYWIINTYKNAKDKQKFFNDYFKSLAGTTKLRKQIEEGMSEKDIRLSWNDDLVKFKAVRKKYLLYKDFE